MIGFLLAAILTVSPTAPLPPSSCHVAAHRGYTATGYTENGMGAYRAAVNAGAETVEADVRVSSDDRLMLIHDTTYDRTTTGTGTVRSQTGARGHSYRLDDGYYRVPYLAQLLTLARARDRGVLLELKWMSPEGFTRLGRVVTAYGVERVVIQSRYRSYLREVRRVLPTVKRVLFTTTIPSRTDYTTYDGIVIDQRVLTPSVIQSVPSGELVYPYTVDTPAGWAEFADVATAVITNDTAGYLSWRTLSCP